MKLKLLLAICLFTGICFAFAQKRATTDTVKSDNVSVTITEDDTSYELKSTFNKDLTDKVRAYLNSTIAKGSSANFKNTEVDADMTLDNHASFYISSHPGKLNLKLDKRKNSAEIYKRFKEMCQGIRDIVTKK